MQLTTGTRLGPYRVDAAIGAGGMGEVYRATDTRLDRSVAIKILSAELAADPALHARFDREARAISSLNHSHICALYDIGESAVDGGAPLQYLVMEYLEGESLESRLLKGPLPTEQALRIGIEIADALDKAHRRGIVHRDLKPGNVMLTKSGAKLLDFGLAGTMSATALENADDGATAHRPLTREGTLIGTFQYMSPEQLEGGHADARSDLFALGAILYEMLAGRRAFEGKSRASIIAAILGSEVTPISQVRPMVPPALDRLIGGCLSKDPDDRWQTAHDVMLQLRWVAEGGSKAGVAPPVSRRRLTREWVAWSVAGLVTLVAAALAVSGFLRRPEPPRTVHFSVETPEKGTLFPFDERGIALSPDGSMLAFVAGRDDGRRMIYVRPLRSNVSQPLAGTEDAAYPFWSPDSRFLGFFAAGKLKKIAAGGGPPEVLADAPSGRGGAWNGEGTILFEPTIGSALSRVSSGGGAAVPATVLAPGDGRHRWPSFLPDGKHFLFVGGTREVRVGELGKTSTGTKIIDDGSNAVFVPPDRVVYSRGSTLMTQKLDLGELKVVGNAVPIPIGTIAHWEPKRFSVFSASPDGTLAYLPAISTQSRITWVDRAGREVEVVSEPALFNDLSLSPDGKRIAAVKGTAGEGDIWLVDVKDRRWSRITFSPGSYGNLTWSRDGSKLAYMHVTGGVGQTYLKSLTRDDVPRLLTQGPRFSSPFSISPDGRVMLSGIQQPNTSWDLVTIELDGKGGRETILQTPYIESRATFSPDGRWFAYESNESGRNEVYVRRYPPTADQWQVSSDGGYAPVWSTDGRQLYYLGANTLMSVPIAGGERLDPGTPQALFPVPSRLKASTFGTSGPLGSVICGVSADGNRFLFLSTSEERLSQINVITNWQSLLGEEPK